MNWYIQEPSVIMEDERANVEAHIFCAMEDINAGGTALPDKRWEHIVRCVLRYAQAAAATTPASEIMQSLYDYREDAET